MRAARTLLSILAVLLFSALLAGVAKAKALSPVFSPDGTMVAFYNWGGPTQYDVHYFRIDIINSRSGKPIFRYSTLDPNTEVGAYGLFIAFASDNKSLLKVNSYYGDEYGGDELNVYQIDICGQKGAECARELIWGLKREACGFSASASSPFYLAIPCGKDGLAQGPIFVRSLQKQNFETKIPLGQEPFAWGPDSKSITLVNEKGNIEIWDLSSGGVVKSFPQKGRNILDLAFSKNGRSIFALASEGSEFRSKLYSYDAKTGKERVVSSEYVSAFSMAANAVATCTRGRNKIDIRRFSLKLRRSVKLPYECGWHSLSPDASLVLTYNPKGKRLEARDTKKGNLLWSRQSWEE